MELLLSGLLGALFATFLSVIYSHVAESRRLRAEVAIEVVAHCDEIYDLLKKLWEVKNSLYLDSTTTISRKTYQNYNFRLSTIAKSMKPKTMLNIVHGPGDISKIYDRLSIYYIDAAHLIWTGTKENWVDRNQTLLALFENDIEPQMNNLREKLVYGAGSITILTGLIKNPLRLFRYTAKNPE